jgi:hypothetical protein
MSGIAARLVVVFALATGYLGSPGRCATSCATSCATGTTSCATTSAAAAAAHGSVPKEVGPAGKALTGMLQAF